MMEAPPSGPVHFIYLGGEFTWQHRRAIETADVHGAKRILWTAIGAKETSLLVFEAGGSGRIAGVEVVPLELPDWLRDHPIQLANVKDLYVWRILHEHGGLYLDLDTISLKPVWDLLMHDVLVSTEWPDLDDPIAKHPYNSAVVAAIKGSGATLALHARALTLLQEREATWGAAGPHLLTSVVAELRPLFDTAPFPVLSGWRDDTVGVEYYNLIEHHMVPRIDPSVRVLHLYSSSRHDRFLADRWMP